MPQFQRVLIAGEDSIEVSRMAGALRAGALQRILITGEDSTLKKSHQVASEYWLVRQRKN